MSKDEVAKKIIYSESIQVDDLNIENETLSSSIKKLEEENRVISTSLNRLEEESAMLRELFNNASNELNNLKKPSLLVADVVSILEKNQAIIKLPNGNKFYCYVTKDIENLKIGDSVLVDQKSLNIVKQINIGNNDEVEKFVTINKPKESWKEIGGLNEEITEVKEVIELPLKYQFY